MVLEHQLNFLNLCKLLGLLAVLVNLVNIGPMIQKLLYEGNTVVIHREMQCSSVIC